MKLGDKPVSFRALLGIALALALLGSSAAISVFHDIEYSEDNSFSAGMVDLKIGWEEEMNGENIQNSTVSDDPGDIFNLSSLRPGDTGVSVVQLENLYGRSYGWITVRGENTVLGSRLRFSIWQDEGDGVMEEGENLIFNGTLNEFSQVFNSSKLLDSNASTDEPEGFPQGSYFLGFRWSLAEEELCEIQGEEASFDLGFSASQTRNNQDPLPGEKFRDREESSENIFRTGDFGQCTDCGKVSAYSSTGEYNTEEISSSRVKFEADGEQLGENGKRESHNFSLTVENGGSRVWIKLKNGRDQEYVKLDGEGDTEKVPSGDFTLKLVETSEKGGSTTYRIKLISDSERGRGPEGSNALSHIVFAFCESFERESYFQADLVEGKPVKSPPLKKYRKRGSLVKYRHGDSGSGLGSPEGSPRQPGCIDPAPFRIENGSLKANFYVGNKSECSDGITVSLAIYRKSSSLANGKKPGRLYDHQTETYQPGTETTLAVEVP